MIQISRNEAIAMAQALFKVKPHGAFYNRENYQADDDDLSQIDDWQKTVRQADAMVHEDVTGDMFAWWCQNGTPKK